MTLAKQSAKEVACQLYLSGYALKEIRDTLEDQFGKAYTVQTLYNWKREGDWDSKRTEIVTLKNTKVQELIGDKLAEESKYRYDLANKILKAAEAAIPNARFKTGLSVAQAVSLATEIQRKETANSMRREFVILVERAVTEEYPDIDIDRIKVRLQKIIESENRYD